MSFAEFSRQYSPLIASKMREQAGLCTLPELKAAMTHLLGRGKLFRPLLCLASYASSGGANPAGMVALSTPVEFIHTSTLIHDDLPCMDDAALRRGVEAVHMKYGEATAILAGDALLVLAFHALAQAAQVACGDVAAKLAASLSEATHLVIEGQVVDIASEGKDLPFEDLASMHRNKTGALLGCCCEIGAILAGQNDDFCKGMYSIGRQMGLVFQIKDDLLSIESTTEAMGKSLESDAELDKATYPRLLGVEKARELLDSEAQKLSQMIGSQGMLDSSLVGEIGQYAATRVI